MAAVYPQIAAISVNTSERENKDPPTNDDYIILGDSGFFWSEPNAFTSR